MKKQVYVFLFDGYSDWEISYLTPEIQKNEGFELFYFSKDGQAITSMGGLRVSPHLALEDVMPDNVDLLILPGGVAWEKDENKQIKSLIDALITSDKNLAAICAATTYLANLGYLDHIKHTSNDLNYLKAIAPKYAGESNYEQTLSVSDDNIVTANGVAPIEFAKEIFLKLKLYDAGQAEKWFQLFKNGVWSE